MLDGSFSPSVAKIMSAHGWYPKRRTDVRRYIRILGRVGYPVHEAAETTLAELFGIVATSPWRKGDLQRTVTFGTFRNGLWLFGRSPWRWLFRANWPAWYWPWRAPNDGLFLSEYFQRRACLIGGVWDRWKPSWLNWRNCGAIYMLDDGRALWTNEEWVWVFVANSLARMLDGLWVDWDLYLERVVLDELETNVRLNRYGLH
jgi:hypothetical protein